MSAHARHRIAVVGAGIAGLSAASRLAARGLAVTVFDKGRGVGGRTASRRAGTYRFDHGAHGFDATEPAFAAQAARWVAAGAAAPWGAAAGRFTGVPGMNAPAKQLAAGLDVRTAVRVRTAARDGAGWRLADDAGASLGRYDTLVVAVPPEQAAALLPAAPRLADAAASVRSVPCWTLMLCVDPGPGPRQQGTSVDDDAVAALVPQAGKPGRADDGCWVLQATPAWSARHLEESAAQVASALLAEASRLFGRTLGPPRHAVAHRWRYARAAHALGEACVLDENAALCGDWCLGGDVESAWRSGDAAASGVLERVVPA